jgi:hypothetical protein
MRHKVLRARRLGAGLKAQNVKAWAVATAGPGNQLHSLFRGLKGRNRLLHVPPRRVCRTYSAGELFDGTYLGLRAKRFTPGYHMAGFQPLLPPEKTFRNA